MLQKLFSIATRTGITTLRRETLHTNHAKVKATDIANALNAEEQDIAAILKEKSRENRKIRLAQKSEAPASWKQRLETSASLPADSRSPAK